MTETLANGYSSESTQRGLSNEYQHDRVLVVFKDFCVHVLWMKVAPAMEGLTSSLPGKDLGGTTYCLGLHNLAKITGQSYACRTFHVCCKKSTSYVYCVNDYRDE